MRPFGRRLGLRVRLFAYTLGTAGLAMSVDGPAPNKGRFQNGWAYPCARALYRANARRRTAPEVSAHLPKVICK